MNEEPQGAERLRVVMPDNMPFRIAAIIGSSALLFFTGGWSIAFLALAASLAWLIVGVWGSKMALFLSLALWAFVACPVTNTVKPWAGQPKLSEQLASTGQPGGVPGGEVIPELAGRPYAMYIKGVPVGAVMFSTQKIVYINGEGDDCHYRLLVAGVNWLPYPNFSKQSAGGIGVGNCLEGDDVALRRTSSGSLALIRAPEWQDTGSYQLSLGVNRHWAVWAGWVLLGVLLWRRRKHPWGAS